MKRVTLSKRAVGVVHDAVDKMFDRLKARFLEKPPADKRIYIGFRPRVTLKTLFHAATAEEHARADEDVLNSLVRIAENFVEAQRQTMKAHVTKAVEGWLNKAAHEGYKSDFNASLGGELYDAFAKTSRNVLRILDTEASNVRNTGVLEGVVRVNAALGIKDPVVYFVVVRDSTLCPECIRLHLMPDGMTPRLWRMSEIKQGYHTLADDVPSIGGLHPHCRCSLVTLMPGYGFDKSGSITFIALNHDAYAEQMKKSEPQLGEPLAKSTRKGVNTWRQVAPQYQTNAQRYNPLGAVEDPEELYSIHHAPVTINIPHNAVMKMHRSPYTPRIMNTFETEGGGGTEEFEDPTYQDEYRNDRLNFENSVLGIPDETHREERPVYGALAVDPHHRHMGGAASYGDLFFTLKPHKHAMTSYTAGDSFGSEPEHVFDNEHRHHVLDKYRSTGHAPYAEAQIHGGVYIPEDVESLHINPKWKNGFGRDEHEEELENLKQFAKASNLPLYRHTEVENPDVAHPFSYKSRRYKQELIHDPRSDEEKRHQEEIRGKLRFDMNQMEDQLTREGEAAQESGDDETEWNNRELLNHLQAGRQNLANYPHGVTHHHVAVQKLRERFGSDKFPYLDKEGNVPPMPEPQLSLPGVKTESAPAAPTQPAPQPKAKRPRKTAAKAGTRTSRKPRARKAAPSPGTPPGSTSPPSP